MGKVHLITGYKGEEHIQSADQGSFNASFFGGGEYVMEAGNQFEASIMDNNTVRILDGDLLMQGRHIRIEPDTYEDMTITTGTAGVNRIDLIVMQYSKDTSTDIESAELVVIKGTEAEGTATEPEYTSGNILHGATLNQMPLYRVKVEGVVLTEIEPLFNVIPTYKTLAEQCAKQFQEACDTYIGLLNILDTMEEVEANTQEGQLAGALSVKELKNTLQTAIDTKLPLAGGTMTGKLSVQNVEPTTALTNACGSYAKPFHGMYAGKHVLVDSSGRDVGSIVNGVTGTPSTEGLARLQLGNNIAQGEDGNSTGELILFNAKGAYTNVVPSDTNTSNIWHVLPSKAGYIPVVSVVGNTIYIDT